MLHKITASSAVPVAAGRPVVSVSGGIQLGLDFLPLANHRETQSARHNSGIIERSFAQLLHIR